MSYEEKDWLPDEALENLKMERTVLAELDDVEQARRLFKENLPGAALAITHMAVHSPNERVRLDAAKYVTERVLGRTSEGQSEEARLADMIADFVRPIEEYANETETK